MMTLVHTLAVAEYLNFRHAANALGVAQSSVSARVKALEEDLGILLFERHARGVRLAGDTARAATSDEVKNLRRESAALKEVVADLTLENRLLKKSMIEGGEDDE